MVSWHGKYGLNTPELKKGRSTHFHKTDKRPDAIGQLASTSPTSKSATPAHPRRRPPRSGGNRPRPRPTHIMPNRRLTAASLAHSFKQAAYADVDIMWCWALPRQVSGAVGGGGVRRLPGLRSEHPRFLN